MARVVLFLASFCEISLFGDNMAMVTRKLANLVKFSPIPVTVLAIILYGLVFTFALFADELPDVPKDKDGLNLDRAYENLHKRLHNGLELTLVLSYDTIKEIFLHWHFRGTATWIRISLIDPSYTVFIDSALLQTNRATLHHQITTRPHPYISHANDDVRSYILSRLQPIASRHTHVQLSDDMVSNVSPRGLFRRNNILVKIEGTEPSIPNAKSNGVLFSCHYDSVILPACETAARTAVFFFNNGEEDRLNGAHALFEHPWANLTSAFINLEGAASGGRPLLFRSTSLGPTRSFLSSAVSHPLGNVLTADAFSRGVVRSATDYEIYARGIKGQVAGMAGLDIAFYKNRAYYHTPQDSIPGMGTGQGRKALWAMMETVRGAGLSLLNDDDMEGGEPAVYFDLCHKCHADDGIVLGRKLVLFSLHALFVTNVILLVIGPITILALFVWMLVVSQQLANLRSTALSREVGKWTKFKKLSTVILGWSRFWIALLIGAAVHFGLVLGYVKLNPYIVHSRPYAVLITFLTLAFLAIVFPLQVLPALLPSPPISQKLVIGLELYFFTWVLLVISTIAIQKRSIAGLYWVTVLNIAAWIASGVSLVEGVLREKQEGELVGEAIAEQEINGEGGDAARTLVRGILYEAPPEHGEEPSTEPRQEPEEIETEPTEITPLIHQHRRRSASGGEYVTVDVARDKAKVDEEYGWWILQMVVLVPLPALLLFQTELLHLNALMNTLVDGSGPATGEFLACSVEEKVVVLNIYPVYAGLSLLSLLIFIPVAPFAHKLHSSLTIVVTAILAVVLIVTWIAFPFTQEAPFKVYFQQRVELESPLSLSDGIRYVPPLSQVVTGTGDIVHAVTTLTGLRRYVDRLLIPELPSSWEKNVECLEEGLRPGLLTCKWEGNLLPSPGWNLSLGASSRSARNVPQFLDLKTTRLNAISAIISIKGANTRGCRLYFDKPITSYFVHDASESASSRSTASKMHLQPGYGMPSGGVKELRLWSRTWDRTFEVEVGWEEGDGSDVIEGRAACEWAEYASTAVSPNSSQIPALEEVKQFLPLWATLTKLTDGLMEASLKFSV
ncbi:Vacuolar membrane protease [Grifola frondosa]|uniref:Peptide hydrolase n=1 Tax=Grifola frondosa TaxID=5627 RepID=A0A1C7M007_GRIFR|nr:Vacuolar membrane protease [Grifola frondosa]